MGAGREWVFGSHRATLEEPDVIRVTYEGPKTFEDARAVLEIYREVCGERPRYLIADIGRSSMDPATRKFFAAEVRPEWFLGAVYIGADLFRRVITHALTALIFFHRNRACEIRFAANEDEARAKIEAWREDRKAGRPLT